MNKVIMIVDESSSTRLRAQNLLRAMGNEAILAADSQEGIAQLSELNVHLIICDVNLPYVNGVSFVELVGKLPLHKYTPIVMLTAGMVHTSREQAQGVGVKAWLTKPIEPHQLIDVVLRFATNPTSLASHVLQSNGFTEA